MRAMTVAAVLAFCLAGCARAHSDATTTSTAPASPPEAHFTAKDFAFEGPQTLPSGMTTVVLHNDGPGLHHMILMRLDGGKTVDDFKAYVNGRKAGDTEPAWVVPAGGVNPPMPGADARATFQIEPGTYAVVCEVDVPDHVPHAMKGMISALTVTPSTTPSAAAPDSDVTVSLVNFGFSPSAPFTTGHHVLKIVNDGTLAHEFEVVRLGDGKTMDDLGKWGQTYAGPLPGVSLGGAAPMSPGQVEYVPMDFTPGNYALLCFVTDPKTHMPHLAEGMVLPFTIS
jgi:hypothetical protein